MSIQLTIREVPHCQCGNAEDWQVQWTGDEQALLHKLPEGTHPRKFDGRCNRCGGPVEIACNVIVKPDGLKLVK